MAGYWTRPQRVDAFQWKLGDGPCAGSRPVGCRWCGIGHAIPGFLSSCASPGTHDPVNHPHHLELETSRGTTVVLDGSWVVTLPDGSRQVCTAAEFSERYTATPALDAYWMFRDQGASGKS